MRPVSAPSPGLRYVSLSLTQFLPDFSPAAETTAQQISPADRNLTAILAFKQYNDSALLVCPIPMPMH